MIDIAMLTCNRARITKIAIEELVKRTTTPYRLIVMDNGSIDETPQMLDTLAQQGIIDYLISWDENTGVHWGFNQLLAVVTSEPYYICTDPDIIPPYPTEEGDWLERLVRIKDLHKDYGAISCRPHVFIGAGNLFAAPDTPEVLERSHAGAVMRIMDTKLVRRVGGWKKEKNPSRNNEEWFICGKLREKGKKVGISRDLRMIHLFGEEEFGEDPWGYNLEKFPTPDTHGHREIWPPVNYSSWRRHHINWETCLPEK